MKLKKSLYTFALLLPLVTQVETSYAQKPNAKGAKGKKEVTKVVAPAFKMDPAILEQLRATYKKYSESTDLKVRALVYEGMLDLDTADKEAAITQASKVNDLNVKLSVIEALLSEPAFMKRKAEGEMELQKLLESADAKERNAGLSLFKKYVDPKNQLAWWQKISSGNGASVAKTYARNMVIDAGGKTAWLLVEAGLNGKDEEAKKDSLLAVRAKKFTEAEKWAFSRADASGLEGEVAREWISQATGPKVAKYNTDLVKQYEKAFSDFPKRVRLANFIAKRGLLAPVQETLVIAVKDKKGRVEESLDSAELRTLGWEGLAACRDQEVLNALKEVLLEIKNPEEAKPAVSWLSAWAKETVDGTAIKLLQEMLTLDRFESRVAAIQALGELQLRDSWNEIEKGLLGGNDIVREAAAKALSNMVRTGDEDRFEEYIRKEKTNVNVKVALLKGLGNLGTDKAAGKLQFWLNDRDPKIQKAAVEALAITKTPKLGKLLNNDRLKNAADPDVKYLVWELLLLNAFSGIEKELNTLIYWLTVDQLNKLNQHPELPIKTLASIAIHGGEALRNRALELLAEKGEIAIPHLFDVILECPEPVTAGQAMALYANLAKESKADNYKSLLKFRHMPVQVQAVRAVGLYGKATDLADIKLISEESLDMVLKLEATVAMGRLAKKSAI
jgi:HEAT repeat protein